MLTVWLDIGVDEENYDVENLLQEDATQIEPYEEWRGGGNQLPTDKVIASKPAVMVFVAGLELINNWFDLNKPGS